MRKVKCLLAVAILATLSLAPWASAQTLPQQCEPEHKAAIGAIENEKLAQGLDRKLTTKVENAWRIFQAGEVNHKEIAVRDLDVALHLLDSEATRQISLAVVERLRGAIQTLKNCFNGVPTIPVATLTVRTFLQSDAAPDGRGEPAGEGVSIRVDGVELGVTGLDGMAVVEVPTGPITVEARRYPSSAGAAGVNLVAGATGTVEIVLDDGKELAEDTKLWLVEAPDGVLDRSFSSFTLQFRDNDGVVLLQDFEEVALLHPAGGASTFVTHLFSLQPDGSLLASNVEALRSQLVARSGKIELRVHGTDDRGRIHDNVVRFYLSRFRVAGRLVAPPSNPGLSTAGIYVTATILNTELVFHAVSDATGSFELPLLPSGNLEFSSETIQDGKYYYGQGIAVLNRDLSLTVNMLNTEDLVRGVPGFSTAPLFSLTAGDDPDARERVDGAETSTFQGFEPSAEAATTASIFVVAASQNVPMFQANSLTVPRGTKEITLTYNVQTDEYPFYVLSQSIYNDTWSIAVRGGSGGQQLFSIPRQINSQLSAPPIWQSNGTTGEIREVFNVESLTANADATVTVHATAMNVGDSILPTRVQATLGPAPGVRINSITPDTVPAGPTGRAHTGDHSYYSIPRPGGTNSNAPWGPRWFTLRITKPQGSTVSRVRVTLLAPNPGMVVVEDGIGNNVRQVDESTLRVRVTMHDRSSTVASTPPPTHNLRYRFELFVTHEGNELSDQRDSGNRHGLWRMPDGFGRYSTREEGGDDWCSRGAYGWMNTNRALLTRINDVSGEHAVNIHHNTHAYGTDIDMFHFYTFPGATSGGDNYNRLAAAVRLAIRTNSTDPVVRQQAQEARDRVIAWANATRTGLDNLAARPEVTELRYILGAGGNGLVQGWGEALLETGRTTVSGTALDLGLGNWTNNRYLPRGDHNDHIHVTLSRQAFGE
jgi:hypothetical protein